MSVTSETQWKQELCEIGRRIWLREYVAANDGNFSLRISENEVLATPTGMSKGFLTPDMICKVDMEANPLEGAYRPSSEILIHLEIYRQRPDVKAVVHAHPPTATGFAAAGLSLQECVLPEVIVNLGGVPLCPYALPGSPELPESLKDYLHQYDAFLLANHGAVTIGPDLFAAYYKMETIEHFAKILLTARLLGGAQGLPTERVQELYGLRERFGLKHPAAPPVCVPRSPTCMGEDCPVCGVGEPSPAAAEGHTRELVERITREVLQSLRSR
ncbi:MAG: class II aldolase/adducin family protein [Armatimonadetes bacterium]|jgi:L-fuculose-phosphate aldolase|nr:class II aldolase/adducin family protein [Armatimonadota bacterium]